MALPFTHQPEAVAQSVQAFLGHQRDVVTAQAWVQSGQILARAVVLDDSGVDGSDLQLACLKKFGKDGSPRLIMVERVAPEKTRLSA